MKRRAVFVLALFMLVSSGWLGAASAQEATPNPTDEHLDIAAMNLATDDLPDDFGLLGEYYVAGQGVAESLFSNPDQVAELMDTGLIVVYSSEYSNAAGDVTIRSYIEQFESAEGAIAGFEILEDESRSDSSGVEFADEPLEGVGESPGEITTYNREAQADSPTLDGFDATFRVGNFLAGVTIEAEGGAAPAASDAVSMSRELERRIRMALSGEEIPGIDQSLPGRMLNFNFPPILEGYVSAADTYNSASSNELFQGYVSGYARSIALGQGSSPLPLISDAISTFESEDGPLGIISAGVEVQPPFGQMERVDLDPIGGADAVVGFHFVSPLGENQAIDSFRILSVAGNHLVTIDIQAAENEEIAKRVALELTEAQLACIDAGNCELIEEINVGP